MRHLWIQGACCSNSDTFATPRFWLPSCRNEKNPEPQEASLWSKSSFSDKSRRAAKSGFPSPACMWEDLLCSCTVACKKMLFLPTSSVTAGACMLCDQKPSSSLPPRWELGTYVGPWSCATVYVCVWMCAEQTAIRQEPRPSTSTPSITSTGPFLPAGWFLPLCSLHFLHTHISLQQQCLFLNRAQVLWTLRTSNNSSSISLFLSVFFSLSCIRIPDPLRYAVSMFSETPP